MSTGSQHEEYERVLRTMRERLDSVSDAIAKALLKIEWQSETAPTSVRISARAAAAEIAHTQDWLRQRLALLPIDPKQRYDLMRDLLQAQFVALEKVTEIVQGLLTLRDKPTAPEYLPPSMRPADWTPPPPGRAPAGIGRDAAGEFNAPTTRGRHDQAPYPARWEQHPLPQQGAPVYPSSAPLHLADLDPPTQSKRAASAGPRKAARRTGDSEARDERDGLAGNWLAVRTAVLAATVALTAGAGYVAYTSLRPEVQATAKAGSKPDRVAIGDPAARGPAGQRSATAPPVRSLDTVQPRVPSAPPMSAPPLEPAGAGNLPGLVLSGPPGAARPAAGEQRFVALVGTHRDPAALQELAGSLRRQFPGIVGTRRSEMQALNLGDKGMWHHLILLPAGSREQVTALCEELRAAGYARCAVRPL